MRPFMIASILCLAATASHAGPYNPVIQTPVAAAPIIRIADGCGPGFHQGPRGFCRPNAERVVVERPVVLVRPPVVEEVVVRRPVVPTCGVRVGPIAVRGVC